MRDSEGGVRASGAAAARVVAHVAASDAGELVAHQLCDLLGAMGVPVRERTRRVLRSSFAAQVLTGVADAAPWLPVALEAVTLGAERFGPGGVQALPEAEEGAPEEGELVDDADEESVSVEPAGAGEGEGEA